MLHDPVLDVDREVDIVIEGELDGEPMIVSIEVVEHGRPAPLPWVQEQLTKHDRLPTNRLVLVSKSGFTKQALAEVAAAGLWVEAIEPRVLEVDGEAVSISLFIETIQLKPLTFKLAVIDPARGELVGDVGGEVIVFDADGEPLGQVGQLALQILNIPWLARHLIFEAHHHEERDDLKSFECRIPVPADTYYLHEQDTGALHCIKALESVGEFKFVQAETKFTETELGRRTFGAGQGLLLGRPGVWVRTFNETTKETKMSWRTPGHPNPLTDGLAPPIVPFSELLGLPEPEGWDSPSKEIQTVDVP